MKSKRKSGSKKETGAPSQAKAAAAAEAKEQEQRGEDDGGVAEEPLFWIDTAGGGGEASFAQPPADEEPTRADDGEDTTRGGGKAGKRKRGRAQEKTQEEAMLESVVFGGRNAASLFSSHGEDDEHDGDEEEDGHGRTPEEEQLHPAWRDEDDDEVVVDISAKDRLRKLRKMEEEAKITGGDYEKRLRARFAQKQQTSEFLSWAQVPTPNDKARRSDDDEEGEEEEEEQCDSDLFANTASLVVGGRAAGMKLQQGVLEVFRCRDANVQEPSQAVIQAIKFHPTSGLMLTAGFDKTLRLFQIDGRTNTKVSGIFFPDLPIQTAAFTGTNHQEVIVSGRRPFFYWYDLETGNVGKVPKMVGREEKSLERFATSPDGKWLAFTGKDGYIILVSAKTKQWVANYKMNGTARAVTFSADSTTLLASGGDAVVYRWDLRSQKCLGRFENEGGTVTSTLATCGVGAVGYTAVGSESGVVNVYGNGDIMTVRLAREAASMNPIKAVMNLTTTVDSLAFNTDMQVMAMASRWTRDAIKMVHVPSMTVFSNWPTGMTPIRYPTAVDFSPNSGYFAVGNDRGKVLLYRLRHYDSY